MPSDCGVGVDAGSVLGVAAIIAIGAGVSVGAGVGVGTGVGVGRGLCAGICMAGIRGSEAAAVRSPGMASISGVGEGAAAIMDSMRAVTVASMSGGGVGCDSATDTAACTVALCREWRQE